MLTPMRAAILVAVLTSACNRQAPRPEAAEGVRGGDVMPVYPKGKGPIDPRAHELCALVHGLPSSLRGVCCASKADVTSARIVEECERNLDGAIRAGAIGVDAAGIGACEKDLRARLGGCDWVGPLQPAAPSSCAGALQGRLAAGARCRSSLECKGDLRCDGAGPTEPGRCAPAGEAGTACAMSVDPLAGFLGGDRVEASHPACKGWCERHRCVPFVKDGGECTGAMQCGPDAHCADRKCVKGTTAEDGGACTSGGCAADARCVAGRCLVPRHDGACSSDFECLGACVNGSCQMDCSRS
jgi:hypothetical protein